MRVISARWRRREPPRAASFTPLSYGIDFRDSSAYVTDPTNDTYLIGSASNGPGEVYPKARGGQNIGWNAGNAIQTRDRSTSIANLAGIHFMANSTAGGATLEVDLPAGTYAVNIAMGDLSAGAAFGDQFLTISDDATLRHTVSKNWTGSQNLIGGHFLDAAGSEFTSGAAWVSGNVAVTGIVISSGKAMIRIGKGTAGGGAPDVDATALSHLFFTRTA